MAKIEDVPEPFRNRAQSIRSLGKLGLIGLIGMLGALLGKLGLQAAGAVDDVWQGPSWSLLPLVILIGCLLDVVAIAMLVQSNRLKKELGTIDGPALEIANRGGVLGGIGVMLIIGGPFFFGWLLFNL